MFFSKADLTSSIKMPSIADKFPKCKLCKLYKTCLSPKMPPSGEGKLRILIVAEAPGEEEDRRNTQLVGKVGRWFRSFLFDYDLSLDEHFWKTNAVACRPPKNRTPTNNEISYCRPNVLKAIRDYKPKVILLLGEVALNSVIGNRWKKDIGSISKWRGFGIPDYGAWVVPMYHPSYVMRNEDYNPAVEKIFRRDFEFALDLLSYEPKVETPKINCIYNEEGAIKVMHQILRLARDRKLLLAFDYETTGIKPHNEGHSIRCVSLSYGYNDNYSFLFYMSERFLRCYKKIMLHPNIYKTAHNMKFEDTWTKVILGYRPVNWVWDTMLNSHILDNRPGINSLKFQSYIHFGIVGYDEDIREYLESSGSANSKNRVYEAPVPKLLLYCGMDSALQYRLAIMQMKALNSPILREVGIC